jgi:hypothetical protein
MNKRSVAASRIKAALKEAFPKVKFSVKTGKYCYESAIFVTYNNNLDSQDVEKIAKSVYNESLRVFVDNENE